MLDSVHHVSHTFVEPYCKYLRVETIAEKDGPLRGQWITNDRLLNLTKGVRKGIHDIGSIPNGISTSPGIFEFPLTDCESWKITTARHVQPGCWNH